MDVGGVRRLYALIRLSEFFAVESVSGIPYQSVSSAFSFLDSNEVSSRIY